VRVVDRVCEIPHEGPFCDLMWSDPEDIEAWAVSPRGAGWLFGRRVTAEFNELNGAARVVAMRVCCGGCSRLVFLIDKKERARVLTTKPQAAAPTHPPNTQITFTPHQNHTGLELICRAHQLVQEGLKYMFAERSLVTVWSAPNYCYRCGNVASILIFDENLGRDVRYFTETAENSTMMAPRAAARYFF
jgi:diadenosine tetraphosphatase ApaH/serine/threonine PP2A family protein phosphatase